MAIADQRGQYYGWDMNPVLCHFAHGPTELQDSGVLSGTPTCTSYCRWLFASSDLLLPFSEPRFWMHYFIMYCSIFMIFVIYVAVFWKLRQRQPSRLDSTQVMSNPLGDQTQERRSHYNAISYKMLTYVLFIFYFIFWLTPW